MRKKITGIIAIFLLFLSLCFIYFYYNPKKALLFILPDLNDIDLVRIKVKNDTAYVQSHLILENKSFYTITIDTVFLQLKLHEVQFVKTLMPLHLRQAAHQVDTVNVPLRLPIKKIRHTIASLQGQDSTDAEIKAFIVYNTFLGSVKVPVEKQVRVRVPTPPKIKIDRVERSSFHLKDKTIDVNIFAEIINRGKMIDLRIHRLHYAICLGDSLVTSSGVIDKSISIKPGHTTPVELPITLHINKPVKVLEKYITKDETEYTVKITAEVDEHKFAKDDNVPLIVEAKGKTILAKKKHHEK